MTDKRTYEYYNNASCRCHVEQIVYYLSLSFVTGTLQISISSLTFVCCKHNAYDLGEIEKTYYDVCTAEIIGNTCCNTLVINY